MRLALSIFTAFLLGVLIFLILRDTKLNFLKKCSCGCAKCGKAENVDLIKLPTLEQINLPVQNSLTQIALVKEPTVNEAMSRMLGFTCYN